jgi:hypothetical protein
MKRLFFCVIVVSLGLLAPEMSAQTGWGVGSWQAIGSTGMPDEADTTHILMQNDGWAEIPPELETASVKLRYNIPPVEGLRGTSDPLFRASAYVLRAWIRDNGPAAQVIVRIKQISWTDGSMRTLAEINSDVYPTGSQRDPTPDAGIDLWSGLLQDEFGFMKYFRPFHNAYWAEVRLIKTAPEGRAGIKALGVLIDEP